MRLPNGYGGVVKLSGNRRRPYAARITTGWHINDITGKRIQHYQILGYAPTRSEALQILARYNNYPIDGETLKINLPGNLSPMVRRKVSYHLPLQHQRLSGGICHL